jgi:hypothetical protein
MLYHPALVRALHDERFPRTTRNGRRWRTEERPARPVHRLH